MPTTSAAVSTSVPKCWSAEPPPVLNVEALEICSRRLDIDLWTGLDDNEIIHVHRLYEAVDHIRSDRGKGPFARSRDLPGDRLAWTQHHVELWVVHAVVDSEGARHQHVASMLDASPRRRNHHRGADSAQGRDRQESLLLWQICVDRADVCGEGGSSRCRRFVGLVLGKHEGAGCCGVWAVFGGQKPEVVTHLAMLSASQALAVRQTPSKQSAGLRSGQDSLRRRTYRASFTWTR